MSRRDGDYELNAPVRMDGPPLSEEAEEAVCATLLGQPDRVSEVIAAGLDPVDFYRTGWRAIYAGIVEAFYADDPIDPLSLAARHPQLGIAFGCQPSEVAQRLQTLADTQRFAGDVMDHAKVVREKANLRKLLMATYDVQAQVAQGQQDAAALAGLLSQEAMNVVMAGTQRRNRDTHIAASGLRFLEQAKLEIAAKKAGVELGALFGISAVDNYTYGVRPTETLICGGEPGIGKTMVWVRGGFNFAKRQALRPAGQRVGLLMLSIEMSEYPMHTRIANMLAGVDGGKWRQGNVTREEYERTQQAYAELADVPLWLEDPSTLRASQMRAMISEYVAKQNVGVVIVDHFRMFDLDERLPNKNDEDEEKARFLKEQLAGALNVAVVCLAHTRKKSGAQGADARPTQSDLRGSGMISAFTDFLCFIHRPYLYASDREKEDGDVDANDAEMIWAKNRHGLSGIENFYFNPAKGLVM